MTKSPQILTIENQLEQSEDLTTYLENLKYQICRSNARAPETLELVRTQKTDLVFLDTNSIDQSTWELAEKIQYELHTPVVIIGPESEGTDWDRKRKPFVYLVKPFREPDLRAAIETALNPNHPEHGRRKAKDRPNQAIGAEIGSNVEYFRAIADFTYDWEYWMAPDGSFRWVSPSCERITGYRPEEFYRDPTLLYTITHPDDRLVVKNFLKETRDVRFIHLDFRIIRRDGQVRWISHNSQSVFGGDGSWQGRRGSNRDVTGRKEVEEQLMDYQRELRSLASELVLAEERERRSIAVDLHDRVGHSLAMAQIKLNQLQMVNQDPEVARLLDEAVGLVEESITDTRSLTMELSPPALYELGLDAALDELAHEIQDQHNIQTEVVDDGQSKPLGADAKVALYRAARELMINAVKHSQSPILRVTLSRFADKIVVEVIDRGKGFDPSHPRADPSKAKSFGLFSVRERIRHMNGEITIDSKPGQGARVTLTVPLESVE